MYLNKFENNNTNNTNINNSSNNNNSENNINKSNNIPVFWAIITTQKLRFIYLSPSLKSLIYNEQDDINFLIGTSLYDYIVPNDIKQIKYNIHSYINSGEFMEKSFRVRIANFIDIANKYNQQINIPKKQLLEEVSFVNCNLMLNVISEFNMLAFFYPYPVYFKEEPYKWYATEIDELWFRIIEQMKVKENNDNLEPFQQLPKSDTLHTRALQILDSQSMSLIYSIPKQRMSKLLGQETSIIYNIPFFPKRFYPPEDYEFLEKKMKFYISTNTKTSDDENNTENTSDSYLKRFYFDHRILHFIPKSPRDPRISQLAQFPDEKRSQKFGTFKCIPVKSLVIPYGKIVLVMTQTVNFFEGDDKNKLTFEIEEINDKYEVINDCKSPLHIQSSSPTYIISPNPDETKTTKQISDNNEDNKIDKLFYYQNEINNHSPRMKNLSAIKSENDNESHRNNNNENVQKNEKININYMNNSEYYNEIPNNDNYRYYNKRKENDMMPNNPNSPVDIKQKQSSKPISLPSINQLTNSIDNNKCHSYSFDQNPNNIRPDKYDTMYKDYNYYPSNNNQGNSNNFQNDNYYDNYPNGRPMNNVNNIRDYKRMSNNMSNSNNINNSNNNMMNNRDYRNEPNHNFDGNDHANQKRSRTFSDMDDESAYRRMKYSNDRNDNNNNNNNNNNNINNNSSLPNNRNINENGDSLNYYSSRNDVNMNDASRNKSNNNNSNNNPNNSNNQKNINNNNPNNNNPNNNNPNNNNPNNNNPNNNGNYNNMSAKSPTNKLSSINNKRNYPVEYRDDYKKLNTPMDSSNNSSNNSLDTNNINPDNPNYSAPPKQYTYLIPTFINTIVNNYDNSYTGESKVDNNISNNISSNVNHSNGNSSNNNNNGQNRNYKGNINYVMKNNYNNKLDNNGSRVNNTSDRNNRNNGVSYHSKTSTTSINMMLNKTTSFTYDSKFPNGDSSMEVTSRKDNDSFIVRKNVKIDGTNHEGRTKIESYYYSDSQDTLGNSGRKHFNNRNQDQNGMNDYRMRIDERNNNYNNQPNSGGFNDRNDGMGMNGNRNSNQNTFYPVNNENNKRSNMSMSPNMNHSNINNYNGNYNNNGNGNANGNVNGNNYNNYNNYNNTMMDTNNNNHGNSNNGNNNNYYNNNNNNNGNNNNGNGSNYNGNGNMMNDDEINGSMNQHSPNANGQINHNINGWMPNYNIDNNGNNNSSNSSSNNNNSNNSNNRNSNNSSNNSSNNNNNGSNNSNNNGSNNNSNNSSSNNSSNNNNNNNYNNNNNMPNNNYYFDNGNNNNNNGNINKNVKNNNGNNNNNSNNGYPYASNNIPYSKNPSGSNAKSSNSTNKSNSTATTSTGKRGRKKILNLNQEYIDNTLKIIKPEKKVKRCENCGVDRSPEWRRGPSGHKTLCNACGLRYSRTINRYLNQQRAKNDGNFDINNPLASISKPKRKKQNG